MQTKIAFNDPELNTDVRAVMAPPLHITLPGAAAERLERARTIQVGGRPSRVDHGDGQNGDASTGIRARETKFIIIHQPRLWHQHTTTATLASSHPSQRPSRTTTGRRQGRPT